MKCHLQSVLTLSHFLKIIKKNFFVQYKLPLCLFLTCYKTKLSNYAHLISVLRSGLSIEFPENFKLLPIKSYLKADELK